MAADGTLYTVPPDELVSHVEDDEEFKPLASPELASRLLGELPKGFEVHTTKHYLIAYNTSKAYAQWCGSLFERLYGAFTNYWTRQGFELRARVSSGRDRVRRPDLVREVCPGRVGRRRLVDHRLLQPGHESDDNVRPDRHRKLRARAIVAVRRREINLMLSRPDAERTVATVIHEATHQIAFNCGLQTRYADIPLWISEGIAVYFETPDLSSPKGWRNFGGSINQARLAAFADYAERRPADSLLAHRRRCPLPRYFEGAGRLCRSLGAQLFLIHQRPKQYRAYLQVLAAKKQLIWDSPAERLAEFTAAFGDLSSLDTDFQRYMAKMLH